MTSTDKELFEATKLMCVTSLEKALAEIAMTRKAGLPMKYTLATLHCRGLAARMLAAIDEVKSTLPRPMSAAWREISAMSPWAVVPCR